MNQLINHTSYRGAFAPKKREQAKGGEITLTNHIPAKKENEETGVGE